MRMLMKPLGAAVACEVRGLGGSAAAMAAATSFGTVGPAKLRSDLSHCGGVRERVRGVEEWVRSEWGPWLVQEWREDGNTKVGGERTGLDSGSDRA